MLRSLGLLSCVTLLSPQQFAKACGSDSKTSNYFRHKKNKPQTKASSCSILIGTQGLAPEVKILVSSTIHVMIASKFEKERII